MDILLSDDLGLPVSNNPNYSSRVCTKCTLKIQNAIEPVRFMKADLSLADVEETSEDCETQPRWRHRSKSPSSAEKRKPAKIPTAEPESEASVALFTLVSLICHWAHIIDQ